MRSIASPNSSSRHARRHHAASIHASREPCRPHWRIWWPAILADTDATVLVTMNALSAKLKRAIRIGIDQVRSHGRSGGSILGSRHGRKQGINSEESIESRQHLLLRSCDFLHGPQRQCERRAPRGREPSGRPPKPRADRALGQPFATLPDDLGHLKPHRRPFRACGQRGSAEARSDRCEQADGRASKEVQMDRN